jgi:hypothetical protein
MGGECHESHLNTRDTFSLCPEKDFFEATHIECCGKEVISDKFDCRIKLCDLLKKLLNIVSPT